MGAYAQHEKVSKRIRRHLAEAIYELNQLEPLGPGEFDQLLRAAEHAECCADSYPDKASVRDLAQRATAYVAGVSA